MPSSQLKSQGPTYAMSWMKKRVPLIAASLFTVLAVLAALIFRDPSDIKLVKGIKPYTTQYFVTKYWGGRTDNLVKRSYSLHMSYDKAVREIDRQLPSSWTREKNFGLATFMSPNSETILVERGRYVTGLQKSKHWSIPTEDLNSNYDILTVSAKIVANVPNADGWITVETERTLSRFESFTTKLKHAITHYHQQRSGPHQLVSQRPKPNAIILGLPMDSDTTSLVSKDQEVSFWP